MSALTEFKITRNSEMLRVPIPDQPPQSIRVWDSNNLYTTSSFAQSLMNVNIIFIVKVCSNAKFD